MKNEILVNIVADLTPELSDAVNRLIPQLNPDVKDPQVWLKRVLDFPTAYLFMAQEQGTKQVVGLTTLTHYPQLSGFYKAWVEDVIVDQNLRGQGIGEKLVRAVIQKAGEEGLTVLNLTSRPDKIAASHLYQKLGFIQVDTNYYRLHLDRP